VKQLLEAGARVNAKTYNGWRPIHNASKHGHFNIVKQLLAADARVNVKTNEGFTPLVLANDGGIRKLLLRNGAEPSR
jgi:ankyrin repeat protein